jgi:hypothetical protein
MIRRSGLCIRAATVFVFDMMEPERPKVDRCTLEFMKWHKFHAADFVIRTDGVCRLNPAMARLIARMASNGLTISSDARQFNA